MRHVVAAPLGMVAALGEAVNGAKFVETFEIRTQDGRAAEIQGPGVAIKQVREWKEISTRVLAADALQASPPK